MKTLIKIVFCSLFVFLISCRKETELPKVTYENSSKPAVPAKVDTTKVAIADLPIQMPGTNYLIFPIGDLDVSVSNRGSYDSSSNINEPRFQISNYSENEITGFLRNLKFQEIGSDSIRSLTNKPILIQTVTHVRAAKQSVLVYTLADMDTNKDNKLNVNDIKSLYLSDISGANFIKISTDFQELIDWNYIESKNRLYFRTIEDANKNGAFDKKDILHYHFVDMASKDWKASDYNPM